MTDRHVDAYLDKLRAALELRDAHDDYITDVIRQVHSHLIDTGEDPYEAFGDPRDYARQLLPHTSPLPFWPLIVVTIVLTLGGGWLLVNGIINLIGERVFLWGINPLWGIVLGSVLLAAWVITLTSVTAVRRGRAGQRD